MSDRPFQILGINHLGIAAKDPSAAARFLEQTLGLAHLGDELVAEQQTNTRMYASGHHRESADARLEILENQAGADGPIGQFITKRGGGIHHLALTVDNLENAISYLVAQGVQVLDDKPRKGAHQTRIAFIHPRSAGGVLIELVEAIR